MLDIWRPKVLLIYKQNGSDNRSTPALGREDSVMLRIAFAFLLITLITLIAISFAFGLAANYPWEEWKIVFAIVLILAALTYLGGTFGHQASRCQAFWECYGEQHIRNALATRATRAETEKSHQRQ